MRPDGERANIKLFTNRYGRPRSKSCRTAVSGCRPQSRVMLTLTRWNGSLAVSCSIGIFEGMLQPAPSPACAATTSVARWIRFAAAALGSLAARNAPTVAPPCCRRATRLSSSGCSAIAAAYLAWIARRSRIWLSTFTSGATNHQCSNTKYANASTTSASAIAAIRDCAGVSRFTPPWRASVRIGGLRLAYPCDQFETLLAGRRIWLDHALQLRFLQHPRTAQGVDQRRGLGRFALDVEATRIVQRQHVQPGAVGQAAGQVVQHRERGRILRLAFDQEPGRRDR